MDALNIGSSELDDPASVEIRAHRALRSSGVTDTVLNTVTVRRTLGDFDVAPSRLVLSFRGPGVAGTLVRAVGSWQPLAATGQKLFATLSKKEVRDAVAARIAAEYPDAATRFECPMRIELFYGGRIDQDAPELSLTLIARIFLRPVGEPPEGIADRVRVVSIDIGAPNR